MGLDQRELNLLSASSCLLVPGEIRASLRFGTRRPIREAPKPWVAERLELRGHVRLAPRAQEDDLIRQRRGPYRGHAHNVRPDTSGAVIASAAGWLRRTAPRAGRSPVTVNQRDLAS